MRRLFLAAALVVPLLPLLAAAETVPALFKVVGPRDEVVIAVTGMALDDVARKLAADGHLTAWQYSVRRDSTGGTAYMPLRQVAIMRNDALRLEPLNPAPLKVAPLPAP